ncbi:MAG: hypothetical protein MJ192_07160 [Clostridia bacterium]|nr:hypothetical protein [Clostridia bacterium]
MRKELLNGTPVPYDLPFDELVRMLGSEKMADFCAACESLADRGDDESYRAVKAYLGHKDKYRTG